MSETIDISLPLFAQCIDDSDKPLQVADEDWVEEGDIYIVTNVHKDLISGEHCFKLYGMSPGAGFDTYKADRFHIGVNFSVN